MGIINLSAGTRPSSRTKWRAFGCSWACRCYFGSLIKSRPNSRLT